MTMPFGTYTNAMRRVGLSVVAGAASAGVIASSTGKAIAVPIPRNTVRRGRDFPAITSILLLLRLLLLFRPLACGRAHY